MRIKNYIPAAALSLALLLSSCTPKNLPPETSSSLTTDISTVTSAVTESTTTTEATTTTTVPSPVPLDHTFNPHVLSDIYVMAYGEGFKENFFRYCDAVLAGEDNVDLDKPEYYSECREAVRFCLPVADDHIYYLSPDEASNGGGNYKIQYSLPKDEFLVKVEEFKTRVEDLVNRACNKGDSQLEMALALYSSESLRLDYDYDMEPDAPDIERGCNPYHALMYDKGICQEIAGAYAYLLLQVGIEAGTCGALNMDTSAAHEWTVVRLDGKYYHCDVTFQCSDKSNLRYFGMNDDQRHYEGDWDLKGFNFVSSNTIWHDDLPIDDTRFRDLWMSAAYRLDREEHMLYCYDTDDMSSEPYFTMSLG